MNPATTTRLHLSQLDDPALAPEYVAALTASGEIIDGNLLIPTDRLNELKRQHGRPLPTVPVQLATVATAAARVLSAAASGTPVLAAPETLATREAQCRSCLYLDANRCTQCGCYTAAKLRLATEHCPIGRW